VLGAALAFPAAKLVVGVELVPQLHDAALSAHALLLDFLSGPADGCFGLQSCDLNDAAAPAHGGCAGASTASGGSTGAGGNGSATGSTAGGSNSSSGGGVSTGRAEGADGLAGGGSSCSGNGVAGASPALGGGSGAVRAPPPGSIAPVSSLPARRHNSCGYRSGTLRGLFA